MRGMAAILLAIIGTLALGVGILYLIQPAGAIPSFFPGYIAHATSKHPTRGYAGIGVGALFIIVAVVLQATATPRRGPLR